MISGYLNKLPKIVLAFLGQAGALVLLMAAVWLLSHVITPPYPVWALMLAQGGLAALLSDYLKLPNWWRWIQLFFPVALYWALQLDLHPIWPLSAFILLWLIFANASKERVPLYLTNTTTRKALEALIAERAAVKFLDLGCGLGGNVVSMAKRPNVEQSMGVETAPLPYLISLIRTHLWGGEVLAQSLWKTELRDYDVVYAFLSPEPMPKLWEKVEKEMKEGTIFVSNSFAVPGVAPTEKWELGDARRTKLFIYHLSANQTRKRQYPNPH